MASALSDRFQLSFVLSVVIVARQFCWAEVFSAISDMEELLETEAVLMHNLETYVSVLETKLNSLKRRYSEYQEEHNEASKDKTKYISNPINAFLLTKRLTNDWKILESLITDTGYEFLENVTMHQNITKFPTEKDLNGAAIGLVRLQQTYNLNTASVARGELNGVQYSSQMTAHDCFEMGRQSFLKKNYYYSLQWMNESMARLNNDSNEIMEVQKIDILDYLAFSAFRQGDVQLALNFINQQLEISPNNKRSLENKSICEEKLAEKTLRIDHVPAKAQKEEMKIYEKLCRGEVLTPAKELAQLKCRYVTNKSAFLTIAPLKLEEAHLKPYIIIYHDVIYDREIEEIKRLAKPRLHRSEVQTDKDDATTDIRISKTAWLSSKKYYKFLGAIEKRVEDMTGLTTETAEPFQIVNYGIGGHYEAHEDFLQYKDSVKSIDSGDRIATVLFYLSDVEQGGATVFTKINVTVSPEKGSAAFWYNLHTSCEPDFRTRHAACPVLIGSKWVCNKWLDERGQEFLRPCELKPDHPHRHVKRKMN